MPGTAMATLLSTTMAMPRRAATLEWPTSNPSSVFTKTPSLNSVLRMSGMLIQLPAVTARKGTRRPARGGRECTRELRVRAVASAEPVAAT